MMTLRLAELAQVLDARLIGNDGEITSVPIPVLWVLALCSLPCAASASMPTIFASRPFRQGPLPCWSSVNCRWPSTSWW